MSYDVRGVTGLNIVRRVSMGTVSSAPVIKLIISMDQYIIPVTVRVGMLLVAGSIDSIVFLSSSRFLDSAK